MSFTQFIERLNILAWLGGLLLFHGVLYYFIGTPNWLFTTLIATGTWVIVLLVLKAVARMMNKEDDPI